MANLIEAGKRIMINGTLVSLCACAWVQGNMSQGCFVKHLYYGYPLCSILPPKTHFYREGQLRMFLDDGNDITHDICVGEDSRTAPVSRLQRKGASHIQVYRPITQCLHLFDEEEKLLHVLEDDLWCHGYSRVISWVNVAAILGTYITRFYTHEWSIVAFYSAYQLVVYAAIHIIGMSLQWGEMDG